MIWHNDITPFQSLPGGAVDKKNVDEDVQFDVYLLEMIGTCCEKM